MFLSITVVSVAFFSCVFKVCSSLLLCFCWWFFIQKTWISCFRTFYIIIMNPIWIEKKGRCGHAHPSQEVWLLPLSLLTSLSPTCGEFGPSLTLESCRSRRGSASCAACARAQSSNGIACEGGARLSSRIWYMGSLLVRWSTYRFIRNSVSTPQCGTACAPCASCVFPAGLVPSSDAVADPSGMSLCVLTSFVFGLERASPALSGLSPARPCARPSGSPG